jgi:hypothetical protein
VFSVEVIQKGSGVIEAEMVLVKSFAGEAVPHVSMRILASHPAWAANINVAPLAAPEVLDLVIVISAIEECVAAVEVNHRMRGAHSGEIATTGISRLRLVVKLPSFVQSRGFKLLKSVRRGCSGVSWTRGSRRILRQRLNLLP